MIKVIDNIISEKYSQFLFEQVTTWSWTFVPNLSYGQSDDYESAGFSCSFYLHENYNKKEKKSISTPEYNYITPLILEAFDKFELPANLNNVFRCRARLTLNKQESKIESKHVDYTFPHLVFLYYINTTDGDTVLFQDDRVIERISPKRGRGILFDGKIIHASSSSTLSPRVILNTNIL